MKILIATNNNHKLKEYAEMFTPLGIEITSPKQEGLDIDPLENGKTFEENSLLKAQSFKEHTSLPVLSDDSGLSIDALDGFPGIYSARFASEQGGNKIANERIIELLKNKKKNASFFCVITYMDENNDIHQFKGECKGEILDKPEGENGFGYDPIFYSFEAKTCFGTASEDVKNKYSHRAKALEKFVEYFKSK